MPLTLAEIDIVELNALERLAALAPDKEPRPPSPQQKKSKKQKDRSELGPLDLEKYLNHYGIAFNRREEGGRTFFRLNECLFDPSHKKNEASIVQDSTGLITYFCFHNSCRDVRTWQDAKLQISGEDSLAPFCEGYDPSWQPPVDSDSFLVFEKGKKPRFYAAKMARFLEEKYSPLVREMKDYGDQFWHYNKDKGLWEILYDELVEKDIAQSLGDVCKGHNITETMKILASRCYTPPENFSPDPMWLNVKNGMLHLETLELVPHAPEFSSRLQLNVNFNPQAKCLLWEDTLAEIFGDDLRKAILIQQFFAYCLYPALIFPCTLIQVGIGNNGKGTVEEILVRMVGPQNVCHLSLARLEDRFGASELKNKLLNTASENEKRPIDVTKFKQVATGDWIQAEVKNKADVTFQPIAKHMFSMNDFPKIRETNDAVFRRIEIVEYKKQFNEDEDDKMRKIKLREENDGIFAWAVRALPEVLKNQRLTIPDSVAAAKGRYKITLNNVLLFVEEMATLGDDLRIVPKELWNQYKEWAEESGINKKRLFTKQDFYKEILLNFAGVTHTRKKGDRTKFFYGLDVSPSLDL